MRTHLAVALLLFCAQLCHAVAKADPCPQALNHLWSTETQTALVAAPAKLLAAAQQRYFRWRRGIFLNWKWYPVIQVLGKGGEGKVFLVRTKDGLQVIKRWTNGAKVMPLDFDLALRDLVDFGVRERQPELFRGLRGMQIFETDQVLRRQRSEYVVGLPLPLIDPLVMDGFRHLDGGLPSDIDVGLTEAHRSEIWQVLEAEVPLLHKARMTFNARNLLLDVRDGNIVLIDFR